MGKVVRAIIRVDDFLLDRVYQPIVNWFSYLWGVHFITLAESVMVGTLLFWFASIIFFALDQNFGATATALCVVAGLFNASAILFIWAKFQEISKRGPNICKYLLFGTRFGTILGSSFFWMPTSPVSLNISEKLYAILTISFVYFLSCDEGPPRRERRDTWSPPVAEHGGA